MLDSIGSGGAGCALRLRSLWLSWFLCLLFHTDLGLMPLFHGLSPAIASEVAPQRLPLVFRAMLVYFLVPLAANLVNTYAATSTTSPIASCTASSATRMARWRRWRWFHLGLSLVYTLTNVAHLWVDIVIPDARADQVLLMAVMVLIGLLINYESWRWCHCH